MGFAGVVRGYPGRLLGSCRPSTRCCARVDGLGGERRDNFRPARRLDTDNHQTLIYHQTLPQGRWNGGTLAGSTLISRTTGRRLVCHVGSGGGTAYDLTSSLAWLSRGMWCAWVQTPRHRPRSLGRPGRWQRLLSAIAHDGDLLLYAVSGSHIMCEDHCLRPFGAALACSPRPPINSPPLTIACRAERAFPPCKARSIYVSKPASTKPKWPGLDERPAGMHVNSPRAERYGSVSHYALLARRTCDGPATRAATLRRQNGGTQSRNSHGRWGRISHAHISVSHPKGIRCLTIANNTGPIYE